MQGRIATLALALSASAAAVSAQPALMHDCYRVTRTTYAIDAAEDGVPVRLRLNASDVYPPRAMRLGKSARVVLECRAVTDRPLNCAVTSDTVPGFDFGPTAVRLAEAGKLTAPAGVWPIDVIVAFRRTPLAHPIVAYC